MPQLLEPFEFEKPIWAISTPRSFESEFLLEWDFPLHFIIADEFLRGLRKLSARIHPNDVWVLMPSLLSPGGNACARHHMANGKHGGGG